MEYDYMMMDGGMGMGALASMGIGMIILYVAIIVLMIVSMWKIFSKAGQPGWAAIVPFYNIYVFTKVLDKPLRWFWGMFVPGMNIVVAFIRAFISPFKLAEKFGKSGGFGAGLLFLGLIFYPVLAFGKAEYQKTEAKAEAK